MNEVRGRWPYASVARGRQRSTATGVRPRLGGVAGVRAPGQAREARTWNCLWSPATGRSPNSTWSRHACGSTDGGIRADGRPRLLGERRPRRVGVTPTRRRAFDGCVLAPDPPAALHNRCNAGCSRSGEGWAAGPSRRDAKRPSGDQGGRHPDAGGERQRVAPPAPAAVAGRCSRVARPQCLKGALLRRRSFRWVFHGLVRRPLSGGVPSEPVLAGQKGHRSKEGAPSGTRTPNPLIKRLQPGVSDDVV